MNFLKRGVFFVSLWMSFAASAQDVGFQNVNEDDFKKIVNDFSANSLHTSISGAGTLGDLFGFELGLVAGLTNTPEIDKLAKEANSGAKADKVPHAELLGMVTVPLGFTLEAGFIPSVGSDEFKYQVMSFAAKWTPTGVFIDLPVDLAIKLQTTKSEFEFESVVSSVNTKYKFDNTVMGLTAFVSKDFIVAAPYFGIGYVSGEGELTASGTPVFDPSYTTAFSASEKATSTLLLVGSEFKLLVLKLGVEYARLFDTDRYSAKLSFFF